MNNLSPISIKLTNTNLRMSPAAEAETNSHSQPLNPLVVVTEERRSNVEGLQDLYQVIALATNIQLVT